jgi:hypothetical protein
VFVSDVAGVCATHAALSIAATHSATATNAVSPRIRGPSQLSVNPISCRSKPTPDLRAT